MWATRTILEVIGICCGGRITYTKKARRQGGTLDPNFLTAPSARDRPGVWTSQILQGRDYLICIGRYAGVSALDEVTGRSARPANLWRVAVNEIRAERAALPTCALPPK